MSVAHSMEDITTTIDAARRCFIVVDPVISDARTPSDLRLGRLEIDKTRHVASGDPLSRKTLYPSSVNIWSFSASGGAGAIGT